MFSISHAQRALAHYAKARTNACANVTFVHAKQLSCFTQHFFTHREERKQPLSSILNVRSSELLSKEWCDIVFEHRNKDYGAYRLRRRAGARYRYALTVVLGGFLLCVALYTGTRLYIRYVLQRDMAEAKDMLDKLKPSDMKDGYKVKFVQTARLVPKVATSPGATTAKPVIVSGAPPQEIIGMKDKFSYEPDQDIILTPIEEETRRNDTTLPLAKQKIVPTEVVKQLPEFPGGAKAFMKWLDDHVVYPQKCVNSRKEGEVSMSFIIGIDGYAIDLQVTGSFDVEVYRTIKQAFTRMPKWQPGRDERGNLTPVKITVPIKYHL